MDPRTRAARNAPEETATSAGELPRSSFRGNRSASIEDLIASRENESRYGTRYRELPYITAALQSRGTRTVKRRPPVIE